MFVDQVLYVRMERSRVELLAYKNLSLSFQSSEQTRSVSPASCDSGPLAIVPIAIEDTVVVTDDFIYDGTSQCYLQLSIVHFHGMHSVCHSHARNGMAERR